MRVSEQVISTLDGVITGDGPCAPFYRRGADLVDFFNQFGGSDKYGQWFPTRSTYTTNKLREANGTPVLREIVVAAVDPRHYFHSPVNVEDAVEYLNQFLAYDGYEIISDGLYYAVRRIGAVSARTDLKNLIFGANGPKPEIVLEDAVANDIRIVRNAEYCLVYDRPFTSQGITWEKLVEWWHELNGFVETPQRELSRNLYRRLSDSLDSDPEKTLFHTYYQRFIPRFDYSLPALIPQVYLHYDPYTLRQLRGLRRLPRQRMDFLLLLPDWKRVVIEIDGKHHYAEGDTASPRLYAEMVSEDRRLKLAGYEVYRFGGYEFQDAEIDEKIEQFFMGLFEQNGLADQTSDQ